MAHSIVALASAPIILFGAPALLSDPDDDFSSAPRCFGTAATIVGTNRGEVLRGTAQADVIVGLGGNDTIYGLAGDDRVCGGHGADRLFGGRGADRLAGGTDELLFTDEGTERIGDTLVGGAGDDRLRAGRDTRPADDVAPDVLSWANAPRSIRIDVGARSATGAGHDRFDAHDVAIVGSRHADVLLGSAGDDRLFGSYGDDRIVGRGGDDMLFSDEANEHKRGGADVVRGGRGADSITAEGGSDTLSGGRGADIVSDAGAGPDVVSGGAGADRLFDDLAATGLERISGGDGPDTLELFSNRINPSGDAASATLDLATGRLRYEGPSGVSRAAVDGVEQLGLNTWTTRWTIDGSSAGDDVSASGSAGTTFRGHAGNDLFSGSDSDDVFDGGPGTDRARVMGVGNDTCVSVEQIDQADCEQVS